MRNPDSHLVIPKPNSYFPALDGMRGMGLVAVVFGHFGEKWGAGVHHSLIEKVYFSIAGSCWIAMEFFFVLSGFLITGILLDTRHRKKGFFRNFYLRRMLRISPLYYLGLALLFLVLPGVLEDLPGYSQLRSEQIWHWLYLQNWALAFAGEWHPFKPINHLWSLAVEEQFYLVWPFLVYYLGGRRMIPVCIGMIVAAIALRTGLRFWPGHDLRVAIYTVTFTRMDSLAIGSLMAIVARREGGMAFLARWCGYGAVASAALISAIVVARHSVYVGDPVIQTVGYFLMGIFGACSVLYMITRRDTNPAVRFFKHPIMVYTGMVSYAAYLVHLPVLYFVHAKVHFLESLPTPLYHLATFALLLGGSVGIATLVWHAFEKQVIKLKDVFAPRPPAAARATPASSAPSSGAAPVAVASQATTIGV